MKFILGSGLVGVIAKEILGDGWEIIPQGHSRYYSFDPALADNYIRVTDSIREIITTGMELRTLSRAFSFGGSLVWQPHGWLLDAYASKVYGEPHPILNKIFRQEIQVFGLRCNDLYKILMNRHISTIKESNVKYGEVVEITQDSIITTTGRFPYERILSTIPLDVLLKALKKPNDLKARDVWMYQVQTDALDFEGADEVLVLDEAFDFYKCYKLGKLDYQFFCLKEIRTPVEYFGAFTGGRLKVSPVARTKVANAIPQSVNPPDLSLLETEHRIQCIGSNAQWDDMIDINTCILRILKMRM
jgi:hypothetical protein